MHNVSMSFISFTNIAFPFHRLLTLHHYAIAAGAGNLHTSLFTSCGPHWLMWPHPLGITASVQDKHVKLTEIQKKKKKKKKKKKTKKTNKQTNKKQTNKKQTNKQTKKKKKKTIQKQTKQQTNKKTIHTLTLRAHTAVLQTTVKYFFFIFQRK